MTDDTIFRVGSITKSVTAWGVVRLVEAGEIRLDDLIERHATRWEIPDSDYATEQVTVQRLLDNSSGVSMRHVDDDSPYAPEDDVPSPEGILSGPESDPPARLEHEPGSALQYSNAGYVVLELLIEAVTGRDYEEYMNDEILGPLEMDDATFTWDERVRFGIATGYLQDGDRGPVFVDPVKGPGGLYATASDVGRFVAAGMPGPDGQPAGRHVLEPDTVDLLHTPAVETDGFCGLMSNAYGLGHFVEMLPDGDRTVSHGGHHTGWLAHYYGVPDTGDGIVVLTNSRRTQRFVADVVDAWTEEQGLPTVAMSRSYSRLVAGVRAVIAVAGLVSVGLGWRLGRGLHASDRRFAPSARESVLPRVVLGCVAIAVAGAWWLVGRDVLSPLLPVLTGWITVVLSVFAVLALLTVLFPIVSDGDPA